MTAGRFEIDPDIRVAATLPDRVYSDPDAFMLQRERIFARAWQYAGHDDLVSVAGQVFPFTLLPGALDEPFVLTRDGDDRPHCLSNVCTHRGTLVVEGADISSSSAAATTGAGSPSTSDSTRCPGSRGPQASRRRPTTCRRCRSRSSSGSSWSRSPRRCRSTTSRDRCAHDSRDCRSPISCTTAAAWDYLVEATWALYIDNYLEGVHIPYVHSSLATTLDYGAYAIELERYAVLQLGIAKPGERAFALPKGHRDADRSVAAYYFWLFPTTMFNVYPWGVSVNVVTPLAVDRTRVSFLPLVWDEGARGEGAGFGLDRVEREDEAIVEAVQRGVRSRLYDRGCYSPTRESGVHHFHRLLAEFMHG